MTLGRLIVNLGAERASIIRVKYITKIFVVGDETWFLLQCGGMFLASSKVDNGYDDFQAEDTWPQVPCPQWKSASRS
jgi:hypothetical protein